MLCGFSAIFFVFAIFLFVVGSGADFIVHRLDIREFLFSTEWYPTSVSHKRYGTLALIVGTVSVTALAMAIAVPFGLGAAMFISEFTHRAPQGSAQDRRSRLLAAIPSVVWGFIGLAMINPMIIAMFDAPIGLNVLNGGIILGLMSVPIIVSIGEDALKAVPDSYREASLAMGASRWQTIYKVLLPGRAQRSAGRGAARRRTRHRRDDRGADGDRPRRADPPQPARLGANPDRDDRRRARRDRPRQRPLPGPVRDRRLAVHARPSPSISLPT